MHFLAAVTEYSVARPTAAGVGRNSWKFPILPSRAWKPLMRSPRSRLVVLMWWVEEAYYGPWTEDCPGRMLLQPRSASGMFSSSMPRPDGSSDQASTRQPIVVRAGLDNSETIAPNLPRFLSPICRMVGP